MGHSANKKQKFRHKTTLEHAAIVSLLEDLVAGVRAGELILEHGGTALSLRPGLDIALNVRATREPGRESLRLELEWSPEELESVLRIGPAADAPPLAARRHSVVAMRELRRTDAKPAGEVEEPSAEIEIDELSLARLPKERLYALARAVGLDGRSQLPKRALARALSECDLRDYLEAEDLRQIQS